MNKWKKKSLLYAIVLFFYFSASLMLAVWLLIRYTKNNTFHLAITKDNASGESSESPIRHLECDSVSRFIRVCIKNSDYEAKYHNTVSITSEGPWTLFTAPLKSSDPDPQKEIQLFAKNKTVTISPTDFSCGTHLIASSLNDDSFLFPELKRAVPNPEYEGRIHLYIEKNGILVVNEVELETYLKSVVVSEMPSSYPSEALKAQAVCARTYAVRAMEAGKKEKTFSDLDDSVSFQVYNNQKASDASACAVNGTEGQILSLPEVQYYSTAYVPGGFNESELFSNKSRAIDFSDNELFAASLEKAPDEGAEYNSPWVRWNTTVKYSEVLNQIEKQYGDKISVLDHVEVIRRSPSGQAVSVQICGDGKEVRVDGEYAIRTVLSPVDTSVVLNNGQEITGLTLLPSAWLYIVSCDAESELISLSGGGYGHGMGMSQCGAAAMAAAGANYRQILDYYYGESELEHVKNS